MIMTLNVALVSCQSETQSESTNSVKCRYEMTKFSKLILISVSLHRMCAEINRIMEKLNAFFTVQCNVM